MATKPSKFTKKYRARKLTFGILSFLCNFGLLIGFFIYGLVRAEPRSQYGMAIAGIVGIVLATLSLLMKKHWRTPLIIVLGAIYFAVQSFAEVLIIIAVAIMLDELIFEPLYIHYKLKTSMHKAIDERQID